MIRSALTTLSSAWDAVGRKAFLGGTLALATVLGGCDEVGLGGSDDVVVIQASLVFTSPYVPPIEDATVLIIDGIVEAVGPRGEVRVPGQALIIDGTNMTVLAGFWNVHVKIPDEIMEAVDAPAPELEALIQERFTRFGFSTLVDTSRPREELAPLVERIDSGEVLGPRILGAAGMEVPRTYYPDPLNFPWSEELLAGLAGSDVALVPAIELHRRALISMTGGDMDVVTASGMTALARLRAFEDRGGRMIFGTGAGYIEQYDPTSDHLQLEDAGVSFASRLAALTTEPAVRFAYDYLGYVEPGMVADLVLVDGDPEADVTAFGRARIVLREGRPIFW